MLRADERPELCGTVLDGRYQLRAAIGTGATAVVFDGLCLATRRRVAIKVLKRNYAFHRDIALRMRREAEVARCVRHPGVVDCWGEGTLGDGSPYLVLEHVLGESLAQLLARMGSLSVPEALALTRRAAGILHGVHSAGYLHRDVKPEHLLLSAAADGQLVVRLLDFGVCHPLALTDEQAEREQGRMYGTPGYASPEQAAGRVDLDARSDLFGLGAMLFEMLTGRPPLNGRNVAVTLRRTIELDAPSVRDWVPHIAEPVAELTADLLARSRHHRPRNARAVERRVLRLAPGGAWIERELARRLQLPVSGVHVATTVVDAPPIAATS